MVSCPECLTPVVGNVLGRKGWTKLPEHFLKLPQRAYGVFRPFDVANQTGPCLTLTWHWPFKQVVSIYWTSVVFNMGMTGLFTHWENTQTGMKRITRKKRKNKQLKFHCWENIIHQSRDTHFLSSAVAGFKEQIVFALRFHKKALILKIKSRVY